MSTDKKDYGKGKRLQLVTVTRKGKTFQALRKVGRKDETPKPKQSVNKTATPEFKEWFGDSKVVDASGKPLVVYRGDFRADKVGTTPKISKATSGRFYFTSNPDIASKYAEGKVYRDEAKQDFENWFTFPQLKYAGERNAPNLRQAWYRLSPEQKQKLIEVLPTAGHSDETGELTFDGNHFADSSHWQYEVKRAGGNWLKAAEEIILSSGAIFNEEREFVKILKQAGIDADYDNPNDERSGVMPVYLSIKNPVDTSNKALMKKLYSELSEQFKSDRSRAKAEGSGADMWDKELRTPKQWIQFLKEDIDNDTTYAWTSIPEKITKAMIERGFDGIKDTGGKMGGDTHVVWIAFEPNQIKSVFNKGKFSKASDNILKSAVNKIAELLLKAQEHSWGLGRRQVMVDVHTRHGVHKRLQWVGSEDKEREQVRQIRSRYAGIASSLAQYGGSNFSALNATLLMNYRNNINSMIEHIAELKKENDKLSTAVRMDTESFTALHNKATSLIGDITMAMNTIVATPDTPPPSIPAPTQEQIETAAKDKLKGILSRYTNEEPIDLIFAKANGKTYMSALFKQGDKTQARFYIYAPSQNTFLGSMGANGMAAPRFNISDKESMKYHQEDFAIHLKQWHDVEKADYSNRPELIPAAKEDLEQDQKEAAAQRVAAEEARKKREAEREAERIKQVAKSDKVYGPYVSGKLPADKYKYEISAYTDLKVDLKKNLGMTATDIAHLVGAPPLSRVSITGDVRKDTTGDPAGYLTVRVMNDDLGIEMKREIKFDAQDGNTVFNELFVTGREFGSNTTYQSNAGIGARILSDQLQAMNNTGLFKKVVVTQAAGEGKKKGGGSWNGFYTWPRYGFDRELTVAEKTRLEREMANSDLTEYGLTKAEAYDLRDKNKLRFSDLMKDTKLRNWWKDYGWSINNIEINFGPKRTAKAKINFITDYAKQSFGKLGLTNMVTGKSILKSEDEQGFYEPFTAEQEELLDALAEKYSPYDTPEVATMLIKSNAIMSGWQINCPEYNVTLKATEYGVRGKTPAIVVKDNYGNFRAYTPEGKEILVVLEKSEQQLVTVHGKTKTFMALRKKGTSENIQHHLVRAHDLGERAYHEGKGAGPLHNPKIMAFAKQHEHDPQTMKKILSAYAAGWNKEKNKGAEVTKSFEYPPTRAMQFQGMPITIETDAGDIRCGVDESMHGWATVMRQPYGFINDTLGADGDEMDCYIGPNPDSEKVFVICQYKRNGLFDENKIMLGYDDVQAAKEAYWNQYDCPELYFGEIFEITMDDLKRAVFDFRFAAIIPSTVEILRRDETKPMMKSKFEVHRKAEEDRETANQNRLKTFNIPPKKNMKHDALTTKVTVIDDPLIKSERQERLKRTKDMADAIAAHNARKC